MNMSFQIVVSPELKNCTLAGTGQGAVRRSQLSGYLSEVSSPRSPLWTPD